MTRRQAIPDLTAQFARLHDLALRTRRQQKLYFAAVRAKSPDQGELFLAARRLENELDRELEHSLPYPPDLFSEG